MGQRKLGHIRFGFDFLYPDDETFEAFSEAVMLHMQSVQNFEETAFGSRGIEVIDDEDGMMIEE